MIVQRFLLFSLAAICLATPYLVLFKSNIILPLWLAYIMLRSSQMNKVSGAKSSQFISCSSLWKGKADKPVNYSDLTQYTLLI